MRQASWLGRDMRDGKEIDTVDTTRAERVSDGKGKQAGSAAVSTTPVVEETLEVGKRQVETGKVRISKVVREHEETVDEPLLRTEVQVERIPRGEMIDAVPQVRYEGDAMIVPVVEEVLVVEKRLRLKEELRITQVTTEHRQPQQVTLRSEEVRVERSGPRSESGS